MKLKLNGLTNCMGRQALVLGKHAPSILFGAGVAGFVGTVALAIKATPKMEAILTETEERIEKSNLTRQNHGEHYSELDRKKDHTTVYVQCFVKIAKVYAPTVIVGVLSIAALGGSHRILTRRNASLGAAYMALQEGFNKYRERVVAELGDEKDREFKFGVKYTEFAEDTENGTTTVTVKHFDPNGRSPYSVIFDEFNPNYTRNPDSNWDFLCNVEDYMNARLLRRGYVFLNEVRNALGFEDVPEGQIVGWLLKNDVTKSDGCIRLGHKEADDFFRGPNKSVMLDFNVDGPIYHLI